jgi:hypothetical protein
MGVLHRQRDGMGRGGPGDGHQDGGRGPELDRTGPGDPAQHRDVENIFMFNKRTGWAVAFVAPNPFDTFVGTIVLKTVDGGMSR